MTALAQVLTRELARTFYDVIPILIVIVAFQGVLRRPPQHLRRVLVGLLYVVVGLTLFRAGLAESLIPIGGAMAEQLAGRTLAGSSVVMAQIWLYAFAALIGFTATLIEPTLIAIAERARDLTGGAINALSLRIVVALGVAIGLLGGTMRIMVGVPLEYMLVPLILMIAGLTVTAPKAMIPLALDIGGVATSVVTVPLIAAFGVSLAHSLPGRDPLTDGFGMIVLALLVPMVSLLAFASFQARRAPPSAAEADHAV